MISCETYTVTDSAKFATVTNSFQQSSRNPACAILITLKNTRITMSNFTYHIHHWQLRWISFARENNFDAIDGVRELAIGLRHVFSSKNEFTVFLAVLLTNIRHLALSWLKCDLIPKKKATFVAKFGEIDVPKDSNRPMWMPSNSFSRASHAIAPITSARLFSFTATWWLNFYPWAIYRLFTIYKGKPVGLPFGSVWANSKQISVLGKFRPGLEITICRNPYHLPKN